jgi:shikimate kinase
LKGKAISHGAVSIINAISTGKGAAIGVNLEFEAEVMLDSCNRKGRIIFENSIKENPSLAKIIVQDIVRKYSKQEYDISINVKSEIPAGKGLKSSSAASNAIALATLSALRLSIDDIKVINIGVDASLDAGVTITGAFDDACASFFGGIIVTDNTERKILRQEMVNDDLSVLIHIPEEKTYTKDFDKSKIIPIKPKVIKAFDLALKGNYWDAMILNGRLHSLALGTSLKTTQEALDRGAIAAGLSGTGPAVAAICAEDTVDQIEEAWKLNPGITVHTSINNSKSKGLTLNED